MSMNHHGPVPVLETDRPAQWARIVATRDAIKGRHAGRSGHATRQMEMR